MRSNVDLQYTGSFMQGARFLFKVDFSKVTSTVILSAIGQAFFTVGAGACATAVYGAYLPANVSIPKSSLIIVGMDTIVAIAAGLAIFPIVFMAGVGSHGGSALVTGIGAVWQIVGVNGSLTIPY